jgi:hypothetical protein
MSRRLEANTNNIEYLNSGEISCYSSLLILKTIMNEVSRLQGHDEESKAIQFLRLYFWNKHRGVSSRAYK